MAGKVRDYRGVHVVTHVVHVLGFPVWPLATYVEIEPQASACVRIPSDDLSFLAAYARMYAPLLFCIAVIAGQPAEALVSAAIALGSFLFLGRLTPRATRLRDAYALVIDHGFDPAWKESAGRQKLRDECDREIALALDAFAPETTSYRAPGQASVDVPWSTRLLMIADVPRVTLARAIVLARIEEAETPERASKKRWSAVQDDLLSKFLSTRPLDGSNSEARGDEVQGVAASNERRVALRTRE
jgi:hypothetical protein